MAPMMASAPSVTTDAMDGAVVGMGPSTADWREKEEGEDDGVGRRWAAAALGQPCNCKMFCHGQCGSGGSSTASDEWRAGSVAIGGGDVWRTRRPHRASWLASGGFVVLLRRQRLRRRRSWQGRKRSWLARAEARLLRLGAQALGGIGAVRQAIARARAGRLWYLHTSSARWGPIFVAGWWVWPCPAQRRAGKASPGATCSRALGRSVTGWA